MHLDDKGAGYRLDRAGAVTLFIDHMSHKWVAGENEGIDHIGVRFLRAF